MLVSFDTNKFERDPNGLINILSALRYKDHYFSNCPDIERITCRTPSSALKYVKNVMTTGLSPSAERIFLRNPNLAIKYLKIIRREQFSDADTQKRFWKKVCKNSRLALDWAKAFKKRLTVEEEEVFVNDAWTAKDYAYHVIKGKFEEKVHNMLVLKSFEPLDSYSKSCLTDYVRYSSNYVKEHAVPPRT